MARRRNKFPAQSNGNLPRYPWEEWMDGSVWEVRRGEDYTCSDRSMRNGLYTKAGREERDVRVHIAGPGVVIFEVDPDR